MNWRKPLFVLNPLTRRVLQVADRHSGYYRCATAPDLNWTSPVVEPLRQVRSTTLIALYQPEKSKTMNFSLNRNILSKSSESLRNASACIKRYTINNHRCYGVSPLNSFAILIGAGAALGLWQIAQNAPALEVNNRLRTGWLILLCTLLGARLFYVLFHLDYYIQHPLLVLAVWQGGLSWLGALTGAAAGLLLAARAWGQPVTELADVMMPLLPPVIIAAWLGCWQTGCAYGALAPLGAWWAVPCLDEACNTLLRFPLQPLAAFLLLLYYAWLENRFKNPLPSGSRMLLAVLGLALVMLAASFFRDDPIQHWQGMRHDFWEALLVALLCLAGLGALKFNPDKQ